MRACRYGMERLMQCVRGVVLSIAWMRSALILPVSFSLVFLLISFADLSAQPDEDLIDAGIWGGMSATLLPEMNPGGLGYGVTTAYHILPHISARASLGMLMHAFNRADYKLLPPSSENTFHARIIPLELMVRLRSADEVDEGGVGISLGAAVTWYGRDELQAEHYINGPKTLPGMSGMTFGPLVCAGWESSRFIGGKRRLFTEYVMGWGLTRMTDSEEKLFFSALRLGATYAM